MASSRWRGPVLSDLRDLVGRASAYRLLLSPSGTEDLCVTSLTGRPIPADFRAELVAHKAELVACCMWRDEAAEIVCATMRRLTDHSVIGCPMDSAGWREADAAVTQAFWSGNLVALTIASDGYEQFALGRFDLYASGQERHRSAE